MAGKNRSSVGRSITVTLDERNALRRYLLDTEGVWSNPRWDLCSFIATYADCAALIADLGGDALPGGRVKLTLPHDKLQRTFAQIRELTEVEHSLNEPEQSIIIAGVCERVLGALLGQTP